MPHKTDFTIISVMGPHAGEDAAAIFARKIKDIRKVGRTYWLVRSCMAMPPMVQGICEAAASHAGKVRCLFVAPSARGGAKPTQSNDAACEFSLDGQNRWRPLPPGLGPVTGHLDQRATALVFDELVLRNSETIDLWEYAESGTASSPVIFRLGASTVCAVRRNTGTHPKRMKTNVRCLVAEGRLVKPYAVWVR